MTNCTRMPKRLLFALGIAALILVACKSHGALVTPTPTATPSSTPNPTQSTATVTATYNGSPYSAATAPPNGSGTIYMNPATFSSTTGCQGSTVVGGSTVSEQTNASGVATFSNLTPVAYYTFFYVYSSSGPTVSVCTNSWTSVTLSYP